MMFKSFLFLAALFLAEARIDVPFLGSKDTKFGFVIISFNASVGSPGQELEFHLADGPYFYTTDFYVQDAKTFNGSGFDPDKSSSFNPLRNVSEGIGTDLNATETVTLGGQILKKKPIQMIYDTETNYLTPGRVGIARYTSFNSPDPCPAGPEKCTTFIQSVLREQKEQVLVLAFDKVPGDLYLDNATFSGKMVLGERPENLCKSKWQFLAAIPQRRDIERQWGFNVSGVSIGKYSWKKPQAWAYIDLTGSRFVIPQNVYNALVKTIGAVSDWDWPCDAKDDLIFNLGEKEIRIKPEMYLEKWGASCKFAGMAWNIQEFVFPPSILSQYCLAYNFENLGIEIAERLDP